MKIAHRHLVIILLSLSFSATAQKVPPGTVKLEPSKTGERHAAFIDANPITVEAWLEFLYWTKEKYGIESAEYKAMLPDSLVCLQAYPNEWRHPRYRHFPIVGISYEQAVKYCAWRTDRVNELLKIKKKKYTASYSLPTEADFKRAYIQFRIVYCYPYEPPVNELTAEQTVMVKGWELSFEPYQGASKNVGFRCTAEIQK
jgi:formylglycine-generating enzyme required for sulfatase activity